VFKDQRDGNKAEQPGSLRVEGSADRAWAATDRRWQSAAVNGVIGPIVVAAFLAGGLSVGRSPAEEPAATPQVARQSEAGGPVPRTIMRLPAWIESFGESDGPPLRQFPSLMKLDAQRRHAPPDVIASPPRREPPRQAMSPETAAELGIRTTTETRSTGRPGRKLLRGRGAPPPDASVTLTAGWNQISGGRTDEAEAAPDPTAEPVAVTGTGEATATDSDGSDSDAAEAPDTSGSSASPAAPSDQPESLGMPPNPADPAPTVVIDPASFRGALPGKTTQKELVESWGEGSSFEREDGSRGLFYDIEPFDRVEVIIQDDVVASIFIRLASPVASADLAAQLEIANLRTVTILDESGVAIGEVFPERGVIFTVKPGTHAAEVVMLEPIDAESFVLRAEGDVESSIAHAIADLEYAVEIDPAHLRAHRLLMVLLAEQGRWRRAEAISEAAARLAPEDTWIRLRRAAILLAAGSLEAALSETEEVLALAGSPPLVTAQAERLLGRIELARPAPDHEAAVGHFSNAIRLAAPLATSASAAIRRTALDLELECHLGTAFAIADGAWQQKTRVLPKWVERCESYARKLSDEVETDDRVELRLCEGVLAVASEAPEAVDPTPYVKRLLEAHSRLVEGVEDPWRKRQLAWQTGQALTLALEAARRGGDVEDMLDNATLTAAYLERGSEHRELSDRERRSVGDLTFRVGILHSLRKGDHSAAVSWFDKTLPLWDDNREFFRTAQVGRLGESYVSMAVSYWQVGRREEAVRLSRLGIERMTEAVERGEIDEQSLAVAYGNLSTMYAEQGQDEQSRTYAEMASRAEASGSVVR
jgi:tetratricopeptide (TPR) repeat protein